MSQLPVKNNNVFLLTPAFGIALFVMLYILATQLYTGGSQVNKNSTGFSWMDNYWCNLLNETAINGIQNRARPVALIGMVVLSLALSVFWFLFPRHIECGKIAGLIIPISGILAMIMSMFLFTRFHDMVTILASLSGLVATAGTMAALYKNRWKLLFIIGCLNVLLVAVNNYLYYTYKLIIYLPLVQKISFACFLFWIMGINLMIYRKAKA